MPLTLPNLDDRRYAELVEEARSLLVTYAPALTNHNPSDPLVTLTELFAYFSEILLFRLNCITDANRIAFLKLLNGKPDGMPWTPPVTAEQLRAGLTEAQRSELDDEVQRTVLMVRSAERAVTAADYELLARIAGTPQRVARAQCVIGRDLSIEDPTLRRIERPGHVSVVIVPQVADELEELIELVANFLEPRRLLTTSVHVVGPRFVTLRVRLVLHLLPDALETVVRAQVAEALAAFLHPITGRGGAGWTFGRNVYVSEIYSLLDGLPGVDFVQPAMNAQTPLDELEVPATPGRVVRNAGGELISVALEPDELVQLDLQASDLQTRVPTVS